MKMRFSVRSKMLLFILLPTILTISLAFYLTDREVNTSVMENVIDSNLNQTRIYQQIVNDWMDKVLQHVELLSGTIDYKMIVNQDVGEINKTLRHFGRTDNEILQDTFETFFIANIAGKTWTDSGTVISILERDYYHKILETRRTVLGQIIQSKITSEHVVVVATPIWDQQGQLVGLLGGSVRFEKFQEMIGAMTPDYQGFVYVVDHTGLAIAHPHLAFKLNIANVSDERVDEKLVKITRQMMSGESGYGDYYFDGDHKLTFYAPLKYNGWSLGIGIPYSEFKLLVNRLRKQQLIIFGILIGLLTVIIYLFALYFSKVIQKISKVLKRVAKGDLRQQVRVKNHDELGQIAADVNVSIYSLNNLLEQVQSNSFIVSRSIQEIASGNEDLSQRTQEQASSLEEISATIEEFNATIEETAANSIEADKVSVGMLEVVNEGKFVIDETMDAMNEITQSSRQIAEIISTVNDIAFQTNLLALNAAVEAARAGEQGRGFAVVAAEVRNLASRTAKSAKEIEVLIKSSVEKVENGHYQVKKLGGILEQIVENVQLTNTSISEIAMAIGEQASAQDQIRGSVEMLNDVTQQNASLVEEIASASEGVREQAEELQKLVEAFRVQRVKRQNVAFDNNRSEQPLIGGSFWGQMNDLDEDIIFSEDDFDKF